MTGVFGDCGLPSLGINVNDWQVLVEKVHVVLHAAATMRFDEQLNVAISVNVTGTREMLALSRKMKHLEAFVHVSTAYSNCHEFHIEERFYDPPMSSANAIKLNECLDIQTLKAITPEYEIQLTMNFSSF